MCLHSAYEAGGVVYSRDLAPSSRTPRATRTAVSVADTATETGTRRDEGIGDG